MSRHISRIKRIDSIIGHIKARFGNELDCVVRDHESIHRSAFWPGQWGRPEFCGFTFDSAGVTTDIVKLGRDATVRDVLACLDRCAEEWRVEHDEAMQLAARLNERER